MRYFSLPLTRQELTEGHFLGKGILGPSLGHAGHRLTWFYVN